MSFGITPLIEGRLNLTCVWRILNVEELKAMDDRILGLLENTQAPLVHGIQDYSKAEKIPSAKDLMLIKSGNHPQVGWVVIVGMDNKLMKFFVSAASQVFNLRLRFMDTVVDALAFLQDIDSTLHNLQSVDLIAAEARTRENGVTLG